MTIKSIIDKVYSKYQPSKFNCVPSVNKYIALKNIYDINNLEIACLLTGYKNIYMTFNQKILKKIDPMLISIIETQKITKKIKKISYFIYYLIVDKFSLVIDYVKEKKVIFCSKSGLKNSLIMQLRDTELNLREFEEPGSHIELDNHYLTGLLLNYKKKDIKFFYQVNFFRQNLKDEKIIKITDENQFANWPENIKIDFYNFIKRSWLKSESYKLYKIEKLEAEDIINYYKKIPIKTIKIFIKNNLNKIKLNLLQKFSFNKFINK